LPEALASPRVDERSSTAAERTPRRGARRWATVILAVGGVITILLSVMPDAFYRLLAFPDGIALIGLAYSLWATTRTAAVDTTSVTDTFGSSPVATAGAE
jgi:hypothetical protein